MEILESLLLILGFGATVAALVAVLCQKWQLASLLWNLVAIMNSSAYVILRGRPDFKNKP